MMIGKATAEVFGYVPKPLKRRMAQLRRIDRTWSESRIINVCVEQALPSIEAQVLSPEQRPSHDNPRRITR